MVRSAVGVVAALAVTLVASASAVAQQASLTLKDSNAEFCHHNTTEWSLCKTGSISGDKAPYTVSFVVKVTKVGTSHNYLVGDGFVRIQNTGTANATIGNIVVNLQTKKGPTKWVTVASDIADATHGDAATWAFVVPGASSEGLGFFKEGPGSGPLSFTDASKNTLWSITPQVSLAPGAFIDLLFSAQFDNTYLNLPVGSQIRLEVIVTFGNAGPRGGSGASGTNLDINGNCKIDCDEKYVRSVPTRFSREVPALEECNKTVMLIDQKCDLRKTGTVTYTDYTSDIPNDGITTLCESATFHISVMADGGTCGGTIKNCAELVSVDGGDTITVNGPIDPYTLQPRYSYTFECCPQLHLKACAKVCVPKNPEEGGGGGGGNELPGFTTYTQGGWGADPNGNNPGSILSANFSTVYPSGVEIGIPGDGGFSLKFTTSVAITGLTIGPPPTPPTKIDGYLPAGGTAGALNVDLTDTLSSSSGVFGGQVLALQLNVDFNSAGILGAATTFKDLYINDPASPYYGETVATVLADANLVLGGGTATIAGGTITVLNDLCDLLNNAFDNGIASDWVNAGNLSVTDPTP